jgi:hypothetical protein
VHLNIVWMDGVELHVNIHSFIIFIDWMVINTCILVLQSETDIISRYLCDYNVSAKVGLSFFSIARYATFMWLSIFNGNPDNINVNFYSELSQWNPFKRP